MNAEGEEERKSVGEDVIASYIRNMEVNEEDAEIELSGILGLERLAPNS